MRLLLPTPFRLEWGRCQAGCEGASIHLPLAGPCPSDPRLLPAATRAETESCRTLQSCPSRREGRPCTSSCLLTRRPARVGATEAVSRAEEDRRKARRFGAYGCKRDDGPCGDGWRGCRPAEVDNLLVRDGAGDAVAEDKQERRAWSATSALAGQRQCRKSTYVTKIMNACAVPAEETRVEGQARTQTPRRAVQETAEATHRQ